jgi:hypothetical protein
MKISKQRRAEIKATRLKKAQNCKMDVYSHPIPDSALKANRAELVTVSIPEIVKFPLFYVDKPFKCRECGTLEVWTAKQQKWWYEIAKGTIETTAVHCKACRLEIKRKNQEQKEHMKEMANKKPHPHEEFFKKI